MSDSENTPWQQTLHWLATHASFPTLRLPARAELLLLIATAAAQDERRTSALEVGKIGSNRDYNAQIRSYTIKRRHAHIKCDNSAKT